MHLVDSKVGAEGRKGKREGRGVRKRKREWSERSNPNTERKRESQVMGKW